MNYTIRCVIHRLHFGRLDFKGTSGGKMVEKGRIEQRGLVAGRFGIDS